MKIELKNIRVNESFSEETMCFKADIFINGKKIGYAKNDGRGGCTNYDVYNSNNRHVLREAEAYAKTLPKISNPYGEPFDSNLEWVIDLAIEKHLTEKNRASFNRKLKKAMESKFCIGEPNGDSYRTVGWKGFTLAQMVERNRLSVQMNLTNLRKQLKGNEVILNDNLYELGLR